MRRLQGGMLALLVAVAAMLLPGPAGAEMIDVTVQLVRPDGAPIAGKQVRLVVAGEPDERGPAAGARLVTDAEGRIRRSVDAPIRSRRKSLDNWFIRHRMQGTAVGVELDIAGRPALFWIELDAHREGTLGELSAFVAGGDGRFDQPLTFHSREHTWSFPDDPAGMRLTGLGTELRFHEMTAQAGAWAVDLVLEQQVFQVR